ncbi:MAG: ABC transporter permease [Firmicutes bacterium]|nr:ABC transporter permease [Bacillota bacterium]MDY5531526.1 ABC transporter permease [Pumilibacteraceae bacterium]
MKKQLTDREKFLRRQRLEKIKTVSCQIAILVIFIALWEILTAVGAVDSFFVSSPSRIIDCIGKTEGLWTHIQTTLLECIYGFIISAGVGLIVAILLWCSPFARKISEPYIVVLNSLPKIALGPLIIIWVGIGTKAIVVMTFLICIIVAIIGFLNGFLAIDDGKILLMRSMGANKWQILTKLILPGSLPNFISVLKVNVGLSWVGTIMGEYLVSDAGLGYLIIFGGQIFKLDLVMMSTVILCALAAVMYFVIALAEKFIKRKRS